MTIKLQIEKVVVARKNGEILKVEPEPTKYAEIGTEAVWNMQFKEPVQMSAGDQLMVHMVVREE